MRKKYNKALAWILALAMLLLVVPVDMRALEEKGNNENVTEAADEAETEIPAEIENGADTEISTETQSPTETENSEKAEETETNESAEAEEPAGTESVPGTEAPTQNEKPKNPENSVGNDKEDKELSEEVSTEREPVLDTEEIVEPEISQEIKNSEETDESEDDEKAHMVYTLHITHTLRYKMNGRGMHLQEYDKIKLTQSDFKNGGYNLLKNVYVHEALTAVLAPGYPKTIYQSDFREDGNGGMEFDAEIRYTLKEGWKVCFPNDNGYSGSSFYGAYEGSFNDVEFVPAGHITVTINYKYSNTGGLAGIDAHAPDVIELLLDENEKSDLKDWSIPHYDVGNPNYHGHSHENLNGFRIVLDPNPLNQFVIDPNGTLENGDFNLRPDVDISSPEYQQAWDAARIKTVTGASGKQVTFSYTAPAENGGTSLTTSSDPEKMYTLSVSDLTEDISLTVYYRRDAGSYTVNHWKAKAGVENPNQESAGDWEPIESKIYPGRVGMLTEAKKLEDDRVSGYNVSLFSQETINPDGSTVINIFYTPKTIRVIFDTDDIYIERQQVPVDGYIKLDDSVIDKTKLQQARSGYEFDCWQYRPGDGTENDRTDLFSADAADSDRFQITQEFLSQAWIDGSVETDGIQVLRLYPKWKPSATPVSVVFWTENLNGQDVQVSKSTYNFDSKQEHFSTPGTQIVHQDPKKNGSFSNAGSFRLEEMFYTGDALVNESGALVKKLNDEIERHLGVLGEVTVSGTGGEKKIPVSDFYEPCKTKEFQILVEKTGEDGSVSEEESATAAANGSTLVYVYLTRKVYTLEFDYYFNFPNGKVSGAQEDAAQIITETSWFSNSSNWEAFENGTRYPGSGCFANVSKDNISSKNVPMTMRVSAKYGADLREVWPADEESRYVIPSSDGNKLRVSWATTSGQHNKLSPGGNVNVPGAYSTMNAAIVADSGNNKKVHHLVAFWTRTNDNNTYRYNYCYEVPELTPEEALACDSIKIYNDASASAQQDVHNTIYLVPKNHKVFLKYGFTDLLAMREVGLSGTAASGNSIAHPENYYAVRIYDGKCYAISRQLVAFSALAINKQNPSARPHLTLVNTGERQDHSTELTSGGSADKGYTSFDNPYDVYFYYTRDMFTITYMSDERTEIGQIELPYGTALPKSKYAYELNYKKTNGDYAGKPGGWSLDIRQEDGTKKSVSGELPVCPQRSPAGTKEWKFDGWGLGPSGVRKMEWGEDARNVPVILEGNLLLYAIWEAPKYTVIFDWAGGTFPNGENLDVLTEQSIPGNRSFISNGEIPRPIRSGFILNGWVVTARRDEDGNKIDAVLENGNYPQFMFDQPMVQDLWVKAAWVPVQEIEIPYTICYLEYGTNISIREEDTVIEKFFPGTTVWASPKVPTKAGYENYVPLTQNESVTLQTDQENKIIFYYAAPAVYQYKVQYKEWENPNTIILDVTEETEKVSLEVCPSEKHIKELNEIGYYVVNEDGSRAASGAGLSKFIKPGESDETVEFYVRPETYMISYQNLDIMGSGAAALNNPATYTAAKGAGRLNNPTGTYTNEKGEKVNFVGWKMVSTREVSGIRDFENGKEVAESVTIAAGSRGNLIFSAVWGSESGEDQKPEEKPKKKPEKSKKKPEKSKKKKTVVRANNSTGSNTAMTSQSPSSPGLGLPQTGAAWWLVWFLAGLGTLMLVAGLLLNKRSEEDYDA